MRQTVAICGLVCSDCPAFIATRKDDEEERKRVAELWATEEYPLKPVDIHCDGCAAVGGRVMSFCEVCDVRECGFGKKVENCAYCDEYPCERLDKVFERSPEAKARLEEIRKGR